jgi:hypothetical protein
VGRQRILRNDSVLLIFNEPVTSNVRILWRVQLLLCKRRINNGDKRPVSKQRIGKLVSAATDTNTTELLLETVFSARSLQNGYKEDNWGDPVEEV